MTCRSCGFENMKRSITCARCGAKLVWDGPVRKRDFRPTRRTFAGGLRRWLDAGSGSPSRLARLWHRTMSWGGIPAAIRRGVAWVAWIPGRIPAERKRLGAASILPGLGHLLGGRTARGLCFFAAWAVLIVAGIHFHRDRIVLRLAGLVPISASGLFSALVPGLLAVLHCSAVMDVVRPGEFCRTDREVRVVALFVAFSCILLYGLICYGIFG